MASPQKENGHIQVSIEFWDALCKTRMPGQVRQVFDFIIRKTWGWNKKEDQIPLSQFIEGTGLIKQRVIEAKYFLFAANMITINENPNLSFTTYGIQKDYEKWREVRKTVPVRKSVPEVRKSGLLGTEKRTKQVRFCENLISQQTLQKTLQQTVEPKALQPQQQFIKTFSETYSLKTGQPFKVDRKHFVMAANLIKQHGIEALIQKAMILADHCEKCDVFFTKNEGWASYTIESLSTHWNRLIPQVRLSDQEIKDQRTTENLRKIRERDERINREISAESGN